LSLGLKRDFRNLVNYNYDETFFRHVAICICRYPNSAAETRGAAMSNDPTQPAPTPAPRSQEPPPAAPPTVRAPAQPAQPATRQWQEPPTQPTPRWQPEGAPPPAQATPPAPATPPGQRQDRWDPPPAPTARLSQPGAQDPVMPTVWQQPRQAPRDTPSPQWTPQDTPPPGQWPPQPAAAVPPVRPRRRRRRVRGWVMALFTVLVLLIVLVIGDRVALAVTENAMASQFQQSGLPVKPSVTIEGFPFLNQLAAKDFKKVDISASNIPAGQVTITSLHATLTGMHISSFSSNAKATVDQLNATAFVSFGAIAGALGGSTGITVTPDGTDKLKISANLGGIASDTEEAQVTQTGAQTISVKILPSSSLLGSLLSSLGSFSFSLPQGVPASVKITGITLNNQGLTVSAGATNATFSK
jgi:LmeA-like phospholipid-binding